MNETYCIILNPHSGSVYSVTTHNNVTNHMISGNYLIITFSNEVIDGDTDKPQLSTKTIVEDLANIKSFEKIINTKKYE